MNLSAVIGCWKQHLTHPVSSKCCALWANHSWRGADQPLMRDTFSPCDFYWCVGKKRNIELLPDQSTNCFRKAGNLSLPPSLSLSFSLPTPLLLLVLLFSVTVRCVGWCSLWCFYSFVSHGFLISVPCGVCREVTVLSVPLADLCRARGVRKNTATRPRPLPRRLFLFSVFLSRLISDFHQSSQEQMLQPFAWGENHSVTPTINKATSSAGQ